MSALATEAVRDLQLESVMAYQNLDLVARYQEKFGLTEKDADILFEDTKKFLFLCGACPGNWSPPDKVDDGWHEFILFTRDYTEFCQKFFHRFLHHEPRRHNDSAIKTPSRMKPTILAIVEMFGRDLSGNWSVNGKPAQSFLVEGIDSLELVDSTCSCEGSCGGGCNG